MFEVYLLNIIVIVALYLFLMILSGLGYEICLLNSKIMNQIVETVLQLCGTFCFFL